MDKVKKAIEIFKNGGIVIFPTDTAIGIGCRIDNAQTVRKLFNIRKRPKTKAVPVLFSSINMVRKYVEEIPQDVEDLMKKYWPGALTLVLHSDKVRVPLLVRGGGEALGVRIPDNKVIRTIIAELGVPILGPSANFSGEKTPFRFSDLNPKLVNSVDYVLNEEVNLGDNVSTVIDCTITPWKIIRQGAVRI
jgi:L-threonylcarbamoyladenylate synthase